VDSDPYDLAPEERPAPRSRPPQEDRPRRRRDEDEDDRPRRRYREDEEDRPRPRRPLYEEEAEEDRPRRRSRRDEEDEPRPRRPRKRSMSVTQMDAWLKAGLIGGLILAVLIGVGIWYAVRTIRRSPFRGQMSTYLTPPAGVVGPGEPRPAVKKMVVVDVQDKDVDGLHFDLPDNLRAATPAEVTTVVWLRWNKATVGTYSTGGSAYQWSCEVTVIDLATRTTLGTQRFTGDAPPRSFVGRRGESRSGDKPTEQVLNYLRNFPRG
jgi:hypothetical protein